MQPGTKGLGHDKRDSFANLPTGFDKLVSVGRKIIFTLVTLTIASDALKSLIDGTMNVHGVLID